MRQDDHLPYFNSYLLMQRLVPSGALLTLMVFSPSQKTTRIKRLLRGKPGEALTATRVRRITNEGGRKG